MTKRKVKLAPELLELLLDNEFNPFTVIGLRDAFEARFGLGECVNSSELRKRIYRNILPLLRKGCLEKEDHGPDEPSQYRITELFGMEYRPRRSQTNKSDSTTSTGKEAPSLSTLRARLNQYQVDMLACAGECKEYQQLVEEFPHLKERVEPMYRSARERSSELMGQLRALNNLLQPSNLSQ